MAKFAMTTAAASPAEPDGAPRLPVLDILRGIAIVGILFMNISDMGGPMAAWIGSEPRVLGWTLVDRIAWGLREVLASGTARCLLEMLFGAGMVILTDRAARRMSAGRVLRAYAWRNAVLFVFGMIHVLLLLWPGDILHTYALAALVVVLFRAFPPRALLIVGLTGAAWQLVLGAAASTDFARQSAAVEAAQERQARGAALRPADVHVLAADHDRAAERTRYRHELDRAITEENRNRSGSARTWARSAWETFAYLEGQWFELVAVWEATGTMLIGAALYRWGVLQGMRTRRFYLTATAAGYAIGIGLRTWAVVAQTRFDGALSFAYAFNELARLATTLGHVGLVNLLLMSVAGARLVRPFAAAGRTALSLYVAQTLICLWVLYPPWGLALYNRQSWAALMLTALAINAGLLWLANWWVRHYAIAPVEWAWRSVIAGQRLPFRHRAGAGAGGGIPAAA